MYLYVPQEARDATSGGIMLNGRWRLQREKRQRKAADPAPADDGSRSEIGRV